MVDYLTNKKKYNTNYLINNLTVNQFSYFYKKLNQMGKKTKYGIGTSAVLLCICFLFWNRITSFGKQIACNYCNEAIKQDTARVLIFNRDTICMRDQLLNPLRPTDLSYQDTTNFPLSSHRINSNKCMVSDTCEFNLMGYFLRSVNNLQLDQGGFFFFPVWVNSCNDTTFQLVGLPIHIRPQSRSVLNSYLPYLPQALSGTYLVGEQLVNNTYRHDLFQFNNLIQVDSNGSLIFDRTFISYYELKMILENCTHLGISGARISSGNIATSVTQSGINLFNQGNIDYFTYRLIGFMEMEIPVNSPITEPGENIESQTTQTKLYIKANMFPSFKDLKSANSSLLEIDNSIPTETWSTPCPPMWYEQ